MSIAPNNYESISNEKSPLFGSVGIALIALLVGGDPFLQFWLIALVVATTVTLFTTLYTVIMALSGVGTALIAFLVGGDPFLQHFIASNLPLSDADAGIDDMNIVA